MSLFTLLSASAALAGLAGCALLSGGPREFRLSNDDLSPDSLVAIVNRQALATGAVRGSGKLRVVTPEYPSGRQLDISLVAQRPDLVRIRGRVGILASIFDFAADTDSLRLYLPRDGVLVAQANLPGGEALSLVASPELVEAILPRSIDRMVPGAMSSGVERVKGGWVVTSHRGEGESMRILRRFYDEERLRLQSVMVLPSGEPDAEPIVRIIYDRHAWTGKSWFPGSIHLELPAVSRRLTLTFQTFEPNPVLDPDVFRMSVPPGTRRLDPEDIDDDFLRSAPPAR
ncbi:MAG: hypothetical protein SGI90_06120 [Candidatus Eisenbacteria bacterium]|nr:hypothetical protein [Candidatus Eisenbacteria bacterium]